MILLIIFGYFFQKISLHIFIVVPHSKWSIETFGNISTYPLTSDIFISCLAYRIVLTDNAKYTFRINCTFWFQCWFYFRFRFYNYWLFQNRVAKILLKDSEYFSRNQFVQTRSSDGFERELFLIGTNQVNNSHPSRFS